MFVSRVVGTGNATATKDFKDHAATPVDTVQIDAANPGDWGNLISVQTVRAKTTLGADFSSGAQTEVTLTSVNNIVPGDILRITDGVNTEIPFVLSVNTTTKVITLMESVTVGTTIASGSDVTVVTTHKGSTVSKADLSNGDTELEVNNTNGFSIGSNVTVGDGSEQTSLVVTAITGNKLQFGAVAITGPIVSGAVVVSPEFDLTVFDEDGVFVEAQPFLSMSDTNLNDFIENRLSGVGNQSIFVILTDLDSASGDPGALPHFEQTTLAGGLDGSAATDNEIIGSSTDPKSGLFLFDSIDEINMVSTPGYTSATIVVSLTAYCENRQDCIAVVATPLSVDTVDEAREHRLLTLGAVDSSFVALYFPWLKSIDPTVQNNNIINVPPDGAVQGIYSAVAANRGVHKAPANEVIRNIRGLLTDESILDFDAAQDILNPLGVNVIRPFPGRGIRVFGARTLFTIKDGRHYVNVRRTLNFVEESIAENSLFAVFEPNDEDLWRRISSAVSQFLFEVWQSGALVPRDDPSRAFFVKCDAETNTAGSIASGRVVCQVGLSVSTPGEFIVFLISGTRDGSGSIVSELAQVV